MADNIPEWQQKLEADVVGKITKVHKLLVEQHGFPPLKATEEDIKKAVAQVFKIADQ